MHGQSKCFIISISARVTAIHGRSWVSWRKNVISRLLQFGAPRGIMLFRRALWVSALASINVAFFDVPSLCLRYALDFLLMFSERRQRFRGKRFYV